MPLASTDIELATSRDVCAHLAIINLFKLRGLRPPAIDDVEAGFDAYRRAVGTFSPAQFIGGAKPYEIAALLATSGRFLSALLIIPHSQMANPQNVLTGFLASGCHLLIFFTWRVPETGEVVSHAVVVESYTEHGYAVIDSEGYPEGYALDLEPTQAELERVQRLREGRTHGSRWVLPFYPCACPPDYPIGINANVVVVYPGLY